MKIGRAQARRPAAIGARIDARARRTSAGVSRSEAESRDPRGRPLAIPARPSSGGAAFSPIKPARDSKSNYSAPIADGGAAAPPAPSLDWVFCGHCGEKIGADDVFLRSLRVSPADAGSAAAAPGMSGRSGPGA